MPGDKNIMKFDYHVQSCYRPKKKYNYNIRIHITLVEGQYCTLYFSNLVNMQFGRILDPLLVDTATIPFCFCFLCCLDEVLNMC